MGVYDMNRTVLIGAIVVLLAAGGWYQFSYKPAQEQAMIEEAAAKAAEAAAAEAAAAEAAAAEAAAAAAAEAAAAAAAATEAATAATEAVTEGAAAVADAATDAIAALDPANFNADSVVALIDGSSLDDATKTTLKTAVEAARANPALVAETIAQVKSALGM
jgi:colicin import membrane protein